MEESVSDVDQGVLVHRGVPDPVRPTVIVVVQWDVVVVHIALVVGHGGRCSVTRLGERAAEVKQTSHTASALTDDDPASHKTALTCRYHHKDAPKDAEIVRMLVGKAPSPPTMS